jgi:putative lipoic acid-binding regulatory protein
MADMDGMMNGHDDGDETVTVPSDQAQLLEAMEQGHTFPGFYPVVVIGHHDPRFHDRLRGAILLAQGSEPFTIRERQSSQGRYIAYHVELYVDTPRTALSRKTLLAEVEGVLWLL